MPHDPIVRVTLLEDNESSIPLTMNAESQNRTKHIDVVHHYVIGVVADGELEVN